jgi:hypothetical protein
LQESDKQKRCALALETTATPEVTSTADTAETTADLFSSEARQIFGQNAFVSLSAAEIKLYDNLTKGSDLTGNNKFAFAYFIKNGTASTLKLGAGERAGVVNSYKSAFGKLPATEAEWSDVIKIGNGRWPTERNTATENAATIAFKKIYLRSPNRSNPYDDAAVTVIAYGLRPTQRNTNSEKAAIKSFKAIYGYAPVSATAWDIVRAIAYSGAKR